MIKKETKDLVRRLHEEGHGLRQIAKQLGISRNSVREILDPDRAEQRRKRREASGEARTRNSALDPFKERIAQLLAEDEELARRKRSHKRLSTKWILRDLRQLGYRGGRTILDDYLRQERGTRRRSRKAFRRFETQPAQEAQQDWSPYEVEIAGKTTRIEVFSLILTWSRHQYLRAYLDQKRPSLLWAHAAAFRHFEGVPWRIVYDRQKTITPFDIDGRPIIPDYS